MVGLNDTIAAAQAIETFGCAGIGAISCIGIGGTLIAFFATVFLIITAVRCRLAGIEACIRTIGCGFVGLAIIADFAVIGIDGAIAAVRSPLAFSGTFVFWRFAIGVFVFGTVIARFTGLNKTITANRELAGCRALALIVVIGTAITFFAFLSLNDTVAAALCLAASCAAISTCQTIGIAHRTIYCIAFFTSIQIVIAAAGEFWFTRRFTGLAEAIEGKGIA